MTLVRPADVAQSLEEREEGDGECRDYVQFSAGDSYVSKRYCGNELSEAEEFNLKIPSTEFMAVFWTDSMNHAPGFKLAASCYE